MRFRTSPPPLRLVAVVSATTRVRDMLTVWSVRTTMSIRIRSNAVLRRPYAR
jgi:hypothetical protein